MPQRKRAAQSAGPQLGLNIDHMPLHYHDSRIDAPIAASVAHIASYQLVAECAKSCALLDTRILVSCMANANPIRIRECGRSRRRLRPASFR